MKARYVIGKKLLGAVPFMKRALRRLSATVLTLYSQQIVSFRSHFYVKQWYYYLHLS